MAGTTACVNNQTDLTNGRAANWAPEIALQFNSRAFPSSTDVPGMLLNHYYRSPVFTHVVSSYANFGSI